MLPLVIILRFYSFRTKTFLRDGKPHPFPFEWKLLIISEIDTKFTLVVSVDLINENELFVFCALYFIFELEIYFILFVSAQTKRNSQNTKYGYKIKTPVRFFISFFSSIEKKIIYDCEDKLMGTSLVSASFIYFSHQHVILICTGFQNRWL